MIRFDDVLILTLQITPTEAREVVIASWKATEPMPAPLPPLRLEGRVVGPLCEYATTLSGRIPIQQATRKLSGGQSVEARLQILEPCFWEPQHPFCYELQLELHDPDRLIDMKQITFGIRHLSVDGRELLLNGQECFIDGAWHESASTIGELESWHEIGARAFLTAASHDLLCRTNRWGPMVLHLLPPAVADAARNVIELRNHPSLLMWIVPADITGEYLNEFIHTVHKLDPSRPRGQLVSLDQSAGAARLVDVAFLPAGHPEVGNPDATRPYVVVGRFAGYPNDCSVDNFTARLDEFRESLSNAPGLVGVIV